MHNQPNESNDYIYYVLRYNVGTQCVKLFQKISKPLVKDLYILLNTFLTGLYFVKLTFIMILVGLFEILS